MRSKVVFPEPLEPINACVAPLGILRLTSVSTGLPSNVLLIFCSVSMYSASDSLLGLRLDDGALVIQHLPAGGGSPPECGAACNALPLVQGVGNQIVVGGDLAALEIAGQPFGLVRVRRAVLQRFQHKLPAVTPARSAHFPEIHIGHGFVVPARGAEFRMMKNGLAQLQFL